MNQLAAWSISGRTIRVHIILEEIIKRPHHRVKGGITGVLLARQPRAWHQRPFPSQVANSLHLMSPGGVMEGTVVPHTGRECAPPNPMACTALQR